MGLHIFKVNGRSMLPSFVPDDYVITCRWPNIGYRQGDVVVVGHPHYHTIIKRIAEVNALGEVRLVGDCLESIDSEVLGWLSRKSIIGKVVWHLVK